MATETAPLPRVTSTDHPQRDVALSRMARGLFDTEVGKNMVRAAVAETVGAFLLVFGGTAVATAGTLGRSIAGAPADSLSVGLAFGLVLTALVAALGHVSGAHLNPAVTLGLATTGKFPWKYVPAYVGAQLAGACLASAAVWLVFGDAARDVANLAATIPAAGVNAGQVFAAEAFITFLLVFVVVSVATDKRVNAAVAAPAIGFALTVGVLIGGPISGGAVNPARAFGPMLVAGRFPSMWWIYAVAPILGGIAAALLYDRFIRDADAPEPESATS
jgi:MIP family channel proteins